MNTVGLDAYLATAQARVEALLTSHLDALRPHTPPRLHEAMAWSLLGGGKRLRPVLCLAFSDAVGAGAPEVKSPAEAAAVALEMVHTYSLIHDDLPSMDDDDLRRGRATSHKKFGEAMAILAGDALLTQAFSVLAECRADAEVRAALSGELALAAGARGMVAGQVIDIDSERPASLDVLMDLHRKKTGALIRAACRMGVIAGGGDAGDKDAATAYGEAVGLAFQVIDDVLDVVSTPGALGKPTGRDAEKFRVTFPKLIGLIDSRELAQAQVRDARAAVAVLEPTLGPLAMLAQYAIERHS